jgi:cysteinyl-tRNA synthetase
MTLVFRDALSGKLQPVSRPRGRPLTMYVCGPTIYARAHVGHGRNYLYWDLLRRYFRDQGQPVRHVMNITDFEDKVTERAVALGLTWRALARREERRFLADFRRLGLLPANDTPRASAFIGDMERYAEALTRTGRTHWDGNELYFDPDPATERQNFPVGNELSRHAVLEPNLPAPGADSQSRRVLLFRRQDPPAASWASPWGRGAPGWALECYAMAQRYLGVPVDLHGGGTDLIFPHHYSENAVALRLDGRLFSRRFLYIGFVTQEGKKMSKSVGNLVPLGDALDRYGATALRWYYLTPKYNARLEWDEAAAGRAKTEVELLRENVRATLEPGQGGTLRVTGLNRLVGRVLRRFEDQLGVDRALDELREWSDLIARAKVPRFERGTLPRARAQYRRLERLLGLALTGPAGPG